MDSENSRLQNNVQDGLQNEHNPISREPERTDEEQAADDAADQAEGVDEAAIPAEEKEQEGDEAADQAEGVNEAAGPAEEKDRKGDDDRKLTTDTSPSD